MSRSDRFNYIKNEPDPAETIETSGAARKMPLQTVMHDTRLGAQTSTTVTAMVAATTNRGTDMHHLAGSRAGRHHPLWRDQAAQTPNVTPGLLGHIAVEAEDLLAYIAAIVAHPGYTEYFRHDLGLATELRVPITTNGTLFDKAISIGRQVLWLHTYGQRCTGPDTPPGAPTVSNPIRRPKVITPIPDRPERLSHDVATSTLTIHPASGKNKGGEGKIRPVTVEVVEYTVATMKVVESWFDSRKANPVGTRRSELDEINPVSWPSSYTRGLLELLNVLTMLVDLRPAQQKTLDNVTATAQITLIDLESAGVLPAPDTARQAPPVFKPEPEPELQLD